MGVILSQRTWRNEQLSICEQKVFTYPKEISPNGKWMLCIDLGYNAFPMIHVHEPFHFMYWPQATWVVGYCIRCLHEKEEMDQCALGC